MMGPIVAQSRPSTIPMPKRSRPLLHSGLRLQILMALAGLMFLLFVPLFFAVASVARATVLGAREEAARDLGRAIAAQLAQARGHGAAAMEEALRSQVGPGGVSAACAFTRAGELLACAGAPADEVPLGAARPDASESARPVRGTGARAIDVTSPVGDVTVVARTRADLASDRGTPLVRLVALYMALFALALLCFAYFALTRLIVRPVEQLVDAADRVASGARAPNFPRKGARELIDVGESVQAMADKLISEEAALILKVDELTETTARLTQAQAQLVRSERMASVGRLAAGVAHEIGNPITALIGMEDLLLDGDLPPDTQRDFVVRMRAETGRINSILRDLLDFARPERTPVGDAPPAPASVRAVVGDVVSLVSPQKVFRSIALAQDVSGDPRVVLPAPRLTQVLLNLLMNAGHALAGTGREDGHVTVRAGATGDGRVRIEIEDDGPGISPAVRDRLFEPFVTTKDVGEGTGLGLAVCRGLVESAGGEIGVDPAYKAGARFYLVLPAA
jgi:signal transduction histidine kinase